jgi:hypothetical protein
MEPLANYFKERFPVIPLFIFSFLTIAGLSNKIQIQQHYLLIALLSVVYTSFLLHLRILDEFKDFEYDSKYHPDRPIQRGAIPLERIKYIGIVNILVMTITSVIASKPLIIPLIIFVILYSLLMYKEFFIHDFYKKSPSLYLISHQIVFIPLYLFLYSSIESSFWLPESIEQYSLLIYTFIPMILVEIGRKMKYRLDKHGNKTDDTYLVVWGEKTTIGVFSALVILSGLLSFLIQNFPSIASTLIVLLGLCLAAGGMIAPKKIIKFNMVITVVVVLGIPALLLL